MQGRGKSDGLRVCLPYIQQLISRLALLPRYSSWIIGRPVSLASRLVYLPNIDKSSHARPRSSTSLSFPVRIDTMPRGPQGGRGSLPSHMTSLCLSSPSCWRFDLQLKQGIGFAFSFSCLGAAAADTISSPCLGCTSPLRYPLPISSSRQHRRPIS